MKGSIPIFISCKNGWFDVNELYKLNTVAERFGNEYARTVLVTTELSKTDERAKYLRARAKDMNVRFVEDPDSITEKELEKELKRKEREIADEKEKVEILKKSLHIFMQPQE